MTMRTVHDPFVGQDVQISDKLVDRLRGKYACGPHLPNGNPEFGWRQFQAPPIQHEAAARIEELEADAHAKLRAARVDEREMCARQVRHFIVSEKLIGETAELVERIARSVECPF